MIYGPTERGLIGRFLREIPRERAIIATKFGFRSIPRPGRSTSERQLTCQHPPGVRRQPPTPLGSTHDRSVLSAQSRSRVAIEETVGSDGGLVRAGKVRALGLSEAGIEPCAAPALFIQSPLSRVNTRFGPGMWRATAPQRPAASGCGFVPYSPLWARFFDGTIQSHRISPPMTGDTRIPRFQEERPSSEIFSCRVACEKSAQTKGCSPAQLRPGLGDCSRR